MNFIHKTKKNMYLKILNFPIVNFYILILSLTFSCNSEVNINSINKNQLSKETSLYLKQHSQNPINWQRWSNEIFDVSVKLVRSFKNFLKINFFIEICQF